MVGWCLVPFKLQTEFEIPIVCCLVNWFDLCVLLVVRLARMQLSLLLVFRVFFPLRQCAARTRRNRRQCTRRLAFLAGDTTAPVPPQQNAPAMNTNTDGKHKNLKS